MNRKYRLKNDLNYSDMNFSILTPWKNGICKSGKFCFVENEKMLFVIDGDANIGFCLECILNLHKEKLTFLNGKKIDIEKEMNRDNDDITKWTTDALDEEIFNTEENMVYEYTHGRGRKILVKYWQKLQDHREKNQ